MSDTIYTAKILAANLSVWLMYFFGIDLHKLHTVTNEILSDASLMLACILTSISIYKILTKKSK